MEVGNKRGIKTVRNLRKKVGYDSNHRFLFKKTSVSIFFAFIFKITNLFELDLTI